MKASPRKQPRRVNSLVRQDSASYATDHEYLDDGEDYVEYRVLGKPFPL